MLAYSSIAHAGYVLLGATSLFGSNSSVAHSKWLMATPLLGVASTNPNDVLNAALFYLLAYALSAVGAFATVAALERHEDEERGTAWDLERFAGLAQRRPGWAIAMAIFMLSLGGIPPTIGFFGKLLIFRSAIDAGYLRLAIIGILSSVAGAYYYLRVVVYMFMRPAPEEGGIPERHWGTDWALGLSALGVVLLGIAPGIVSGWLESTTLFFFH
jgi:NADH-quinone oxidoreductase subunit N